MIAQFYIYSKTGIKLVYLRKHDGTFTRNGKIINQTEYDKALAYFQSHR